LASEEGLAHAMAQWHERCFICHQAGQPDDHELYQCTQAASGPAWGWMLQVRGQVRYRRYSGCFRCGLPQSICAQWVDNGHGGWQASGHGCQYRGTLISMVAAFHWLWQMYQE
jgi:hypothetical protein